MARTARGKLALTAMMGIMLGMGGGIRGLDVASSNETKKPNDNKMPLTPEELEEMSQLEGREKKEFVKRMRAKYAGSKA